MSVPEKVLAAVLSDLAKRTGQSLTATDINLTSYQQKTFGDPSLGCPDPEMMYAQVLTPGHHLIVTHNGKSYDYRVNARSLQVVLCDPTTNTPAS